VYKRDCVDDFERIMLPHLDAAYKLARWQVRNPAVAEDVVQEAFLRALKYFASFHGGSGRVWLLQIVRNVSYSHLAAERSRMEVPLGRQMGAAGEQDIGMDVPDPGVGPEVTLMHRQELGQINKVLSALPVKLRECIVLRELEELSYKDIARITGAPIGTVMSRLSRARQAMSKATVTSLANRRLPLCPTRLAQA
jgi:RNA polymerase sigma-70 factor (ECF subfamily)